MCCQSFEFQWLDTDGCVTVTASSH